MSFIIFSEYKKKMMTRNIKLIRMEKYHLALSSKLRKNFFTTETMCLFEKLNKSQ